MHYDVIVVGAGPAGLYAARELAKNGRKVLCVDKKQEIGVPKQCGEGLSLRYFKELDIKVDKKYCTQEINGACLYTPSEKVIDIDFGKVSGYILERKSFEKELAKEAALAGAEIRVMSPVVEVKRENGKVRVKTAGLFNEENTCDLIFACDGPQSFTAGKLGLNVQLDSYDIDSGFQYEMAGINYEKYKIKRNMLHIYFGNEIAKRGYCWIFPKGESANVGIGIGANVKGSAREYLDAWIKGKEMFKGTSIIEVNSGVIPVGGLLDALHDDNLLVCGDAARQVNPVHGGGIGAAMEAANIAVQVAEKAFKKKDFSKEILKEYTETWYKGTGAKFRKLIKVRHMLEQFTDADFEILGKAINGDDVLKIAEGELPQAAAIISKKLLTNPGLMKIMLKFFTS